MALRARTTDADELLLSTRSARRTLDLDAAVDMHEIADCLRIGLQAANGTNQQSWRWLVVTDAEQRRRLAELYRASYEAMTGGGHIADALPPDTDFGRLMASTEWLVDRLADVPVHVIPCYQPYVPRTPETELFFQATLYGSIFPAAWNFQLALRSRGYGSCITTVHLTRAAAAAEILGIPESYTQGCLLPVARLSVTHTRPAPRKPLEEVTALDHWDGHGLGAA
jgi:nitroreductase